MSNTSKMYHHIKEHIEKIRNAPQVGEADQFLSNQVINRACLILSLEYLLSDYRQKHSTIFNPLNGKDALVHLIINKYNWLISDVREMPLNDLLLAVTDELSFTNLPDECKNFLVSIHYDKYHNCFEDFPDEEWDASISQLYL
ncbi:hypothetical protein Q4R51_19245 [Morganella morganii]|uniref:ECs1072 family phage-associated protein n=1 Tax=Morganella morganii TaxID=582 RepID=UPI001BDAA2D1|nr:hypothetical protein [Morganella morganii]MBT0358349.1 hypothetical protein [Morganella morganii subsp. morganii]